MADQWREFFSSANCGIFDVIEQAIMVAACDNPKEFRSKRDRIGELLFSCHLTRCTRCDSAAELAVTTSSPEEEEFKSGIDGGLSKESKTNSCGEGGDDDHVEVKGNQVRNFSYGDAEALNDEIDEENEFVGEVLRIKEILQHFEDESDAVLLDLLRRLELMELNFDILKMTEIGKAVKGLKKCRSKQIRNLAIGLIEEWKIVVDKWVEAGKALTESTPDSVNPSSVDDEEGLPSPPLDVGAFFSTQDIKLSQIFEDIDDDGNLRNSGNREATRKEPIVKHDVVPKQREQSSIKGSVHINDTRVQQIKKQAPVAKPLKAANAQFGPGRPVKPNSVQRAGNEAKVQPKSDKPTIQRRPPPQTETLRNADEDAVKLKLEATKRKLQERYQQAESAKRQRTIQVMEVHDLPKQGLGPKNGHGRTFGNHNRPWMNGRR